MTGGTISGNTCGFEPTTGFGNIWGYGGGVYVHTSDNFIMTGGTISNNTVKGGLILTVVNTTIDMTNERHAGGGGVYVFYTGSFTKTGGGSITGNTALSGNAIC